MSIVVKRDCRVLTKVGTPRSPYLQHQPLKFLPAGNKVEVSKPRLLRFEGKKEEVFQITSLGWRRGGFLLKYEAETMSEQGKLNLAAHGPP